MAISTFILRTVIYLSTENEVIGTTLPKLPEGTVPSSETPQIGLPSMAAASPATSRSAYGSTMARVNSTTLHKPLESPILTMAGLSFWPISGTAACSTLLIYRNTVNPDNDWIEFALEGTKSNRSAIGATLTLFWDGKQQVQIVSG